MPVFDAPALLHTVPQEPGVYRMLGKKQTVLYVGKAKRLKNRLTSYFRKHLNSLKTKALMALVVNVEFTVTRTEKEALILEHNLIKKHQPRFNVIFRDDKTYPYIYVSTDQTSPRFSLYRGHKKKKGRFFGPYPSAGSIRQSLNLLQKIFQVRQCDDSYFKHRSRPCLQHQIKRCSAPCTQAISQQDYRDDVQRALLFLAGKGQRVTQEIIQKMEAASSALNFEAAATYRDQIKRLNQASESQYVEAKEGDVDVIFCQQHKNIWGVQLLFIRAGKMLGDRVFFPKNSAMAAPSEVMLSFIQQYYLQHDWPKELVLNMKVNPKDLMWIDNDAAQEKPSASTAPTQTLRQCSVPQLTSPSQGPRHQWLKLAEKNLQHAVHTRLSDKMAMTQRWQALELLLGLEGIMERMECFDISHTSGTETVASCVVFGREGAIKSHYRRFKITGIQAGDDYAAMEQVLRRRYSRLQKENGTLPTLVLVDGGKGQLSRAEKVFEELALKVMLVGVAKGSKRIVGQETLFLVGEAMPLPCDEYSPALNLIQQIRDEAHRFAITGHRQRRARSRKRSLLEDIPGIGQKRRRELLNHFGGAREVAAALEEDLARVPGISQTLAKKIHYGLREADLK